MLFVFFVSLSTLAILSEPNENLGSLATVVNGLVRPNIGGISLFSVDLLSALRSALLLLFSVAVMESWTIGGAVVVVMGSFTIEGAGVEVAKEKLFKGVLTLSCGTLFVRNAGRGGGGSSFSRASIGPPRPVTLLRNFPPPAPPPVKGVENELSGKLLGAGGGLLAELFSSP